MKINCPACGHKVELDDAYDDYDGEVRCWVCSAVFEIRIEDGYIKAVRSREFTPSSPQQ
jgi:transcription elongation factor Elf1